MRSYKYLICVLFGAVSSCAGTYNACSSVRILLLCKGIHSFGWIQCASALCAKHWDLSLFLSVIFFLFQNIVFHIVCLFLVFIVMKPLCRTESTVHNKLYSLCCQKTKWNKFWFLELLVSMFVIACTFHGMDWSEMYVFNVIQYGMNWNAKLNR